nr:MAG TPA: hypothetical protein [Bacteriophage sp.]
MSILVLCPHFSIIQVHIILIMQTIILLIRHLIFEPFDVIINFI